MYVYEHVQSCTRMTSYANVVDAEACRIRESARRSQTVDERSEGNHTRRMLQRLSRVEIVALHLNEGAHEAAHTGHLSPLDSGRDVAVVQQNTCK